ncbi:MAG: glycosyltransferase family 39 protein, partial [Rickettsiales bacterium]|nr:glycosyltransferase family 39 protein [Rickettsiales bacterium]
MSPRRSAPIVPPSLQQWLLALCVGAAAVFLLSQHLAYLNHLDMGKWGRRYLMVNRDNTAFLQALRRMKTLVCAAWFLSLAFGLYTTHRRLLMKRLMPDAEVEKRLALGLFFFLFTVVNYDPPDIDLSLYFFFNSIGFAGLAFSLYSLPHSAGALSALGRLAMRVQRVPSFVLGMGVFCFMVYVSWRLGSVFFNHLPLTVDTSAQLVHAKILLFGRWWLPSHPLRHFFNMYMMVNDGRWSSQYPPGHVMLLAVGTYLKARALVNPLLGAFTALVVWRLAREIYGERVGRIALMLAGGCVYLLMLSSEYMNNATSLFTGSLFLWSFFRLLKRPDWQTGLWGGAAIGYCFITRPYSAIALAFPYVLYAVYLLLSQPEKYRRPLLMMASAGCFFVAFQLYYNSATTGHMFTFGYEKSWGQWHNPLSDDAKNKLSDSELLKNYRENMQRTGWFNRMTFEWPVPSLFLLALVYGWRGGRNEKLLLMAIASYFASCLVLPGNVEREWGPRLMYEILAVILVLSAKALSVMPAFFRRVCRTRRPLSYYYGFALVFAVMMYGFSFSHNLRTGTLANIYNFYYRGN